MPKLVDVSHQITDGMTTCPGFPEPVIEESTTVAGGVPGHGNSSGRVTMVGATGTFVEMPAHRYRDGADPADLDRPEPDERDRLMADSRYLHQQDTPVPPRRGSTGDD